MWNTNKTLQELDLAHSMRMAASEHGYLFNVVQGPTVVKYNANNGISTWVCEAYSEACEEVYILCENMVCSTISKKQYEELTKEA